MKLSRQELVQVSLAGAISLKGCSCMPNDWPQTIIISPL